MEATKQLLSLPFSKYRSEQMEEQENDNKPSSNENL